jgi:predicted ATPase
MGNNKWIKKFKCRVGKREFNLDFTDRPITFITGPNGYGKSSCLNDIQMSFPKDSAIYNSLYELYWHKYMGEEIPELQNNIGLFLEDDGTKMENLSDGELQQRLLYSFLCNSKESIILIDTPEIFLHMEVKLRFLYNLEKIQEHTKSQYIIATHSPELFKSNWSLVIDLFENAVEIG